jgi:tripartite-type tricarboxylate transporter receptor subunit TctC
MRHLLIAVVSLAAATAPLAVQGQAYPTKSIRFIVPVTTGGPSDIVARLLGERLSASLGTPVIVDNRPGASNTVGAAMVAKANPDGYTLLQAAANMATNPILMTDLPFDAVKDFAPVSLTHLTPYVIAVSAQSPVKSLPELIKYIKDNPGKVTYGTTGEGSPQQLATLLFAQTVGGLGNITEVPYKGSSAAHPDLIANRITFMIDPSPPRGRTSGPGCCAGWRSPRPSAIRPFPIFRRQSRPGWPVTISRAGAVYSCPPERRVLSCRSSAPK